MSININFGQKASIFDETIYILGKPGIRVNSGQIKPGKWQKNIKTWDSGSWKTWEMGKMTWENLGLAPSGGVDTLHYHELVGIALQFFISIV